MQNTETLLISKIDLLTSEHQLIKQLLNKFNNDDEMSISELLISLDSILKYTESTIIFQTELQKVDL